MVILLEFSHAGFSNWFGCYFTIMLGSDRIFFQVGFGDMGFLEKSWTFIYRSVLFSAVLYFIPINNCKVRILKMSSWQGLFLTMMYSVFWRDRFYCLCYSICCFRCEILFFMFSFFLTFRRLDVRHLNTVDIFDVDFRWSKRGVVTGNNDIDKDVT